MPDRFDISTPLPCGSPVQHDAEDDAVELVAAARLLGLRAGDVYAIVSAGQLDATPVSNGRIRITRSSIARYVQWRDGRRAWVRDLGAGPVRRGR